MAEQPSGITEISVAGFKSIENKKIEIRPLTILAGANSSGKSSIMQPMLLMKQTLEATYDPGPLLLNGPHLQFTKYEQLLHKTGRERLQTLTAGFEFNKSLRVSCEFTFPFTGEEQQRHIELSEMSVVDIDGSSYGMTPQMTDSELVEIIPRDYLIKFANFIIHSYVEARKANEEDGIDVGLEVSSSKCFLHVIALKKWKDKKEDLQIDRRILPLIPIVMIQDAINKLMHVPGLRGNPQRAYPFTPVEGPRFQGPFQPYTASLIWRWQEEEDSRLKVIRENLTRLGLTKWVKAERIDDVSVNLKVGRLPVISGTASEKDIVDIADVGFGVSQVLPVLVALAVAEPGQMVYIEQPELHLHPNAQVALAKVLANAAMRGVRVVIETHSAMLLQGIMTLIAEEKLESEQVMLHWFTRDKEGKTEIIPGGPDENGAYGDWPVDFANIAIDIHGRYLRALAAKKSD